MPIAEASGTTLVAVADTYVDLQQALRLVP